jgi:cysteinyl-tRNA synthetase
MLQVYSTLTRKKAPFHKQPGERVTMYVCGPTVYKPSHIGHMVGPVIFDTVKRYLTYLGYTVEWVVNITDVDDKLIKRAGELGTTVPALATKMTDDYYDCLKKLNVTGIDKFPKATEHIAGMIEMISGLIANDIAYAASGDVYFDVSKDADYGKLCNRDPESLEAGARLELNQKKRNPGDFALWKGAKADEPAEVQYDSPWGKGRPGWHIECSAMSKALLGDTIDIHGGGLDLQFPHHENELAQSESATDKEFAKVWMHNGLLRLRTPDGKADKMAGSKGNVLNVADAFAKGVTGDLLRFYILGTHYRSPIDLGIWNPETEPLPSAIIASKGSYEKFLLFADRVRRIADKPLSQLPALTKEEYGKLEAHKKFTEYMNDDFNTGGAVGVLFELATSLNKFADANKLEATGANEVAKQEFLVGATVLRELGTILGLSFTPVETTLGGGDALVSGLMQLLLDLRANLRVEAKAAAKDNPLKKSLFDQTDLIRTRLAELNITLEDRPAGTTWRVG